MNKKKVKDTLFSVFKLDIIHEIIFSGIGCCFVILLYNIFPEHWHFSALSIHNYLPKTICSILVIIFFLIFLLFNQPNSKIKIFKVNYKRNIILFSIFNFALIYFLFFNTEFSLYGMNYQDNWLRSAYITKMANSGYPRDFIYKDLNAFYAPFYWYCLALYARIFSVEPYKMLRYGFLFSYYFIPILLYESWKKIYNMKLSFIITVLSLIIVQDFYYIDHIIAILFLIPYIFYYYENYTKKEFKIRDYIVAGFLGSIIITIFFLYCLIIPIYCLISLIQNKNKFKEILKRFLLISTFLIIFTAWFWFPLLINILNYGFESHQNLFFTRNAAQATFFDDLLPVSIFGIIFFIGLAFILLRYSNSLDLKVLGNLIISNLIIILIGLVGILIRFPIMHRRFIQLYMYLLAISAGIFYMRFFYFLEHNIKIKKINLKRITPNAEICLFIFIVSAISYYQVTYLYDSPFYEMALEEEVPEDIIEMFEKLDYEDKVFLTNHDEVVPYIPVYLFISPRIHYSHPSSLHHERVEFLIEMSESKDSKSFYKKATDNKFDTINYFWLINDSLSYFRFNFEYVEYKHGVSQIEYATIKFKKELFNNSLYFEKIVIDEEVIYKTI